MPLPTKLLVFQLILFRPNFCRVLPIYSSSCSYSTSRPPFFQNRPLLTTLLGRISVLLCLRKFSTRSGSERMGPVHGASKRLIEDEAELNDWVSGLYSKSFNDGEGNDDEERNVDREGFRGGKRRRDSAFGKNSDFSGRRGGLVGRGSGKFEPPTGSNGESGPNSRSGNPEFSIRLGGAHGLGEAISGREKKENGSKGRDRSSGLGDFGRGGKFGGRMEKRKSGEGVFGKRTKNRGERRSLETRSLNRKDSSDSNSGMGVKQGVERLGGFKELIDSDESDDDEEEEIEEGGDKLFEKEKVFDSYLSEIRFDQCSISPLSLKGVKDAGYEKMTLVQAATLPVILKGKDVMAKAKTGTGKTVAFLLPAIEHVVQLPSSACDKKHSPIHVLVICPTRELATQAAAEANKLLKYHPSIGVQVVIGGTRLALEQKRMQAHPCQVRQISHIALKRDHEFINTVQEGSEDTHSQVRQMQLVAPLDKHFPLLYTMLKDHIADDLNYKTLVFCTTAMVTRLVAALLDELKLNVREIHSRKPQSYRTRISDEFRKSKGIILVTSDVSARGVDYPDVTLVIQIGVPADRQQYIHRLGRTGRKGKEGQGILLLAPWEVFFLSNVKDLPISKAPELLVDPETRKKVERALAHVEMKNKEAAYQAWLGYYNSNKNVGRDKHRLVELANEFSRTMGLNSPPAIPKLVLGKMGLKNVPGLRSK